jgi:hypothetical protein
LQGPAGAVGPQGPAPAFKIWTGTAAQYAAIATKDVSTVYVVS